MSTFKASFMHDGNRENRPPLLWSPLIALRLLWKARSMNKEGLLSHPPLLYFFPLFLGLLCLDQYRPSIERVRQCMRAAITRNSIEDGWMAGSHLLLTKHTKEKDKHLRFLFLHLLYYDDNLRRAIWSAATLRKWLLSIGAFERYLKPPIFPPLTPHLLVPST